MKTIAFALALLSATGSGSAVLAMPTAHQQMAAVTPDAQKAEAVLKALMTAAASGPASNYDYDMMTPAVAESVRTNPETAEMVREWGPSTSMQYLGNPPGGHLFRVVYPTVRIDFFMALNTEGKISAMYFHPSTE